jgi:hypothetical protein
LGVVFCGSGRSMAVWEVGKAKETMAMSISSLARPLDGVPVILIRTTSRPHLPVSSIPAPTPPPRRHRHLLRTSTIWASTRPSCRGRMTSSASATAHFASCTAIPWAAIRSRSPPRPGALRRTERLRSRADGARIDFDAVHGSFAWTRFTLLRASS